MCSSAESRAASGNKPSCRPANGMRQLGRLANPHPAGAPVAAMEDEEAVRESTRQLPPGAPRLHPSDNASRPTACCCPGPQSADPVTAHHAAPCTTNCGGEPWLCISDDAP